MKKEKWNFSTRDLLEWDVFPSGEHEPGNISDYSNMLKVDLRPYSVEAREEFNRMEKIYVEKARPIFTCFYKHGWGVNLISWVFPSCNSCTTTQLYVYKWLENIVPPINHWNIEAIRIYGHSATVVYHKNSFIAKGYVFDPWVHQKPEIFEFYRWPFKTKDGFKIAEPGIP